MDDVPLSNAIDELDRTRNRSVKLRQAASAALAGQVAAIVATFVCTPLIVRGLGDAQYGIFATVTLLSTFLIFSDFGVGSALVTRLADASGREDTDAQRRLVGSSAVTLVVASALGAALLAAVALTLPVARWLGASPQDEMAVRTLVVIYGVVYCASVPMVLGQRLLQATQRGREAARWRSATSILSSVLAAATALAGAGVAPTVLVTLLPPLVLGFVQTVRALGWVAPELRPRRADLNAGTMRLMSRSATAFLVLQVTIAISYSTDTFVVAAVLGATEAARFSIVTRLFSLVATVVAVLTMQFWAAAGEAFARGDNAWVSTQYRRLTLLSLAVASTCSVGIVVLGRPFIGWWVGESLVPPLSLLVVMGFWITLTTTLGPTVLLLNAAHVLRMQIVTAVIMTVLNLPLSVVLAHRIGITGPVVASLLVWTTTTVVPYVITARRLLANRAGALHGSGG